MTAWAHEGATHSPILAAISVEPDSGKSTLLGVLRFLVPKPFVSVEPTGPSVTSVIVMDGNLVLSVASRERIAQHRPTTEAGGGCRPGAPARPSRKRGTTSCIYEEAASEGRMI